MRTPTAIACGIIIGSLSVLAGLLMIRSRYSDDWCLSMITVAELVDGCMAGDRETCALMDRTVSASCLIQRAVEATEPKRLRFDARRPEEIQL